MWMRMLTAFVQDMAIWLIAHIRSLLDKTLGQVIIRLCAHRAEQQDKVRHKGTMERHLHSHDILMNPSYGNMEHEE